MRRHVVNRITSRTGAAGVAVLVAGAAATAAFAVPPPPDSVFDGNTSQTNIENHQVEVKTDAAGHVRTVYVQWRAKCKVKGKFWSSTTKVSNGSAGLPLSGDVFAYKHSYTANAGGGIKGKISYSLKGSFSDNDNAAGTWSAKVIVKRKGKKIDTCKLPKITWTAARQAEEQQP
jgi:hypothetical protein